MRKWNIRRRGRRRGMMNNTKRGFILFIALAVACSLILAGSPAIAKTKVVKIGNILPLSGPSASVGLQGKYARELATEMINNAGGIKSLGGAKLQNVYVDSKSDPTVGVTSAERLINNDRVNILSGCWNSAVTYPATQVAERYRVPFIVPVSVRNTITERGFKYTFRIAAKDAWWARDQFEFLKDMEKKTGEPLKTVAFVYENGDWGVGMAEQWKPLSEKYGYKIVLNEPYPSTASDLTPVVLKIKRANPDILLLTSNASDAILLTNTMAEMGVKPKAVIGTGGGHADPMFSKNCGKNAEYMFDVVEWEADLNKPGIPELNAEFKKRHGFGLAGESVDAFASVFVIADALERAGSTDPAKVREALANTHLKSGPGMIVSYDAVEFDESGQNINAGIVMVQFRMVDGKLERVSVWPENAARAGFKAVFPMPKE